MSSSNWKNQLPVYDASGLYYKHMTIVNDDSNVIIKWSCKLIDTARGVIYDRHMFIVQATGGSMGPRYIINFYIVKNHNIVWNSATTEAGEKNKRRFGILRIP